MWGRACILQTSPPAGLLTDAVEVAGVGRGKTGDAHSHTAEECGWEDLQNW